MSAQAAALLEAVRSMTADERLELANLLELERPAPELLTAAQAGARLGLHPQTLARMAKAGRIEARMVGREWRFDPDRLDIAPSKPRAIGDGRKRRSDRLRARQSEAADAIRGARAA